MHSNRDLYGPTDVALTYQIVQTPPISNEIRGFGMAQYAAESIIEEHTSFDVVEVEDAQVFEVTAMWYEAPHGRRRTTHFVVWVDGMYVCTTDASDRCRHIEALKEEFGEDVE